MINPKVSIIVPVYNVEKYLERCIKSVSEQTEKNIEIIIVNDCSPDNSENIIKKLQFLDNRITYIKHEENKGVASARNTGLKIANGEFIIFVDSDDFIKKNMIESLLEEAKKGFDVVICNSLTIQNKNQKRAIKEVIIRDKTQNIKNFVYSNHLGPHVIWNKIYRKKFLLQKKIFFDEKFHLSGIEDELFLIDIFLNTKNIKYLDKTLYFHDISNENSFGKTFNEKYLENCEIYISELKKRQSKYPALLTIRDIEKIKINCLFGLLLKEIFNTGKIKKMKKHFLDFQKNRKKLSYRQKIALLVISISPKIFLLLMKK